MKDQDDEDSHGQDLINLRPYADRQADRGSRKIVIGSLQFASHCDRMMRRHLAEIRQILPFRSWSLAR